MTTTITLANMPTSPSDVAVKLLDQSKIFRTKSQVSDAGRTISVDYVYKDGDPTYKTTVRVSQTIDEAKNQIRSTLSLQTVQVVEVDSTVTETAPILASLSWVTPGIMEDAGQVLDMIGTLYSLTFNGVTTKVPNEGIIDSFNFGVLDDIY